MVPITAYQAVDGMVPAAVCDVESMLQVNEFAPPVLVITNVWNAASGVTAIV
jgi:hypothetical protein